MDLPAIQAALRERNIDAWLFYDHHHRDPIAYRVLGLPTGQMVTRRWFYLVPASGDPVKLVHKIEPGHLDSLPGNKRQYSGWQELFDQIKLLLANYRDIAMQLTPSRRRHSRKSGGGCATAGPTNTRSSSGSWRPSGERTWWLTIRRWWRSTPIAAIRTTPC